MATSNKRFLAEVFSAAPEGAQIGLASFTENPKTAAPRAWYAQPHTPGDVPAAPAEANNFFTIACYWPDERGGFRRRAENFAALNAILFDDIGTKAQLPSTSRPLSWLLETSPGNFQGGIVLADPITDPGLASRLMTAIIKKGLCDPGAGGPTARYARLPQGFNSKHTTPFVCRLVEWSPDHRYTVDEIAAGFGLDLEPKAERPKYRELPTPAGDKVKRIASAMAQLDADDYRDWLTVLAACRGGVMLGHMSEAAGCALWWRFSETASMAKRANNTDERYDPAILWANFTPTAAPPEALVATLFAKARDKAADLIRRETALAGELSTAGLQAARYLAEHHRRYFDELRRVPT
ncbi:MAG: hypothetical protein FHK80_00475 [Azoarcus sp. PHD]|mgnify:CR=1 FL=1|nr:MAG: hypothetical protein FHK80_00475 [Azoarcus sp. PHD]